VAYATDLPSLAEARRHLREARRVGQSQARIYRTTAQGTEWVDEDGHEITVIE
jgi:predicted transcriptional regulator